MNNVTAGDLIIFTLSRIQQ